MSAPQEVSSRVWLAAVAGQVDSRTGGRDMGEPGVWVEVA